MKIKWAAVALSLLFLTGCRDITMESYAPTEERQPSQNGAVEQEHVAASSAPVSTEFYEHDIPSYYAPSYYTAAVTLLMPGLRHSGYLLSGAIDDYTFAITGSFTNVSIQTFGDIDTVMYLYSANEELIASDDDSCVGLNSCIEATLSPNDYFVDVRGYSDFVIGSYEILLTVE